MTRLIIVIEDGAIQRLVTDGSIECFIFDKDILKTGEAGKEDYKEDGWGLVYMNQREFDETLAQEVKDWEDYIDEQSN